MTKKAIFGFIISCSFAFNAAVIGMWLTHSIPKHFSNHERCEGIRGAGGSCPMQALLGVSDSVWAPIKPQISKYRKSAQEICVGVTSARASLLNELEKDCPDTSTLKVLRTNILSGQEKMQELSMNHILLEKSMLSPAQRHRFFRALRSSSGCLEGKPGMMGLSKFADCVSVPDSASGVHDPDQMERDTEDCEKNHK
jgi:hypothetical protein